jgi:hypothetical protein
MMLRNSPMMTRKSGVKNWPPRWTTASQEKSDWPVGEVGTLQKVWMHYLLDTCLFLFIEHNGFPYTGSIYFDDPMFCDDIYTLLQTKVGCSIKEIGDLDLSHLL